MARIRALLKNIESIRNLVPCKNNHGLDYVRGEEASLVLSASNEGGRNVTPSSVGERASEDA